jgi:hypothetical protein
MRIAIIPAAAACTAALIATASPARADDSGQAFLGDLPKAGTTVCASTGKGIMTDAQDCPTQAAGSHGYPQGPWSPWTFGYLLRHGYLGKP